VTDLPALNVVVVAYGSPELLDRCLRALGQDIPVLVIDNSSSDRVHEVVAAHSCHYVDPGRNSGFAAGVNRAMAELGPGHGDVLLLNPDAEVTGEVVSALQRTMHADGSERVACVSPSLTRDDGSQERVVWPFPTPWRAWIEAFGLGALGTRAGFVIGAVLLLRGEAIDAIGLLDERFFLYAEETDWQRRAASAGWSALTDTTLNARHTGAATSEDSDKREAIFHASAERYIRKWYGPVGWWIWRAGVVVGAGVRALTGPNRTRQRLRLRIYLRGPMLWEQEKARPA